MKRLLWLMVLLGVGWVGAVFSVHAETIGVVQIASGPCSLIRDGQASGIQIGLKLQENDVLETGAEGTLGIVLRDDTLLSIGPNSRFVLDRFAFSPADEQLGLAARLNRGIMMMVSGQIARMAPESVRIETPMALLGIRGTRFAIKVSE
uniref:FecR protein domain-containing protein n=1 Tax=Desulfatirhabdium butyrativorans TaxID=340467 RepID=A0A7C4RSR7_9BACT